MNRMIEDLEFMEQQELIKKLADKKSANIDIIQVMADGNEGYYNLEKCLEELLELSEVLIKRKLKQGTTKMPSDQSIIEEIGDVQIRIDVLKRIFGTSEVAKRVESKLSMYKEFYVKGKYIGRI